MTDRDPLLHDLAALDPVLADPAPEPRSDRDRRILEAAMTTTTARPLRRPRRLLTLAGVGIAAALLAIVAITVAGTPGDRPDSVAALTEAADATGDVETLRVHGEYVDEGGTSTIDVDIAGRDYHLRSQKAPGHVDGDGGEWTIGIGDQQWSDEDPEPITLPDELRNVPFPDASRAVIRAALEGAEVTDEGTEDVGGAEATHYRIELGALGVAALRALEPNQVAMFELEDPERVTSLDVWVADDLIRRIAHTFEENGATGSVTIDYVDFGADITIEPPR